MEFKEEGDSIAEGKRFKVEKDKWKRRLKDDLENGRRIGKLSSASCREEKKKIERRECPTIMQ